MLDEVGKSIADTGIKRIAKNALKEGVEEIGSELANPLLRSMYKGGEALQDYGTGEYWAGVAKAGIVGLYRNCRIWVVKSGGWICRKGGGY